MNIAVEAKKVASNVVMALVFLVIKWIFSHEAFSFLFTQLSLLSNFPLLHAG